MMISVYDDDDDDVRRAKNDEKKKKKKKLGNNNNNTDPRMPADSCRRCRGAFDARGQRGVSP